MIFPIISKENPYSDRSYGESLNQNHLKFHLYVNKTNVKTKYLSFDEIYSHLYETRLESFHLMTKRV